MLSITFACPNYTIFLRYFIQLSYHGANFHGWQIQPNASSVQQTLNEAISRITGHETYVVGAGRTDTGVHAREMWAHFDHPKKLDNGFVQHLNRYLGWEIAVQNIHRVHEEAHARFDAIARSYQYQISLIKDPFIHDQAWYLHKKPNLELMSAATKELGHHLDFSAFSKSNTQTKTNLCNISEAYWEDTDHRLIFNITADRFLRNMVRAIVGTLVEIGLSKREPNDMKRVIESKDRRLAGESAPAHGLFLTSVKYPKDLFNGRE